MFDLSRVSAAGADVVDDTAVGGRTIPVVHVDDPNSMTQVLGHLKYASPPGSRQLFRGTTRLHATLVPSAYRTVARQAGRTKNATAIQQYMDDLAGGGCSCARKRGKPVCRKEWPCPDQVPSRARNGVIAGTPRAAIEPLLQHYGIGTRWLDVVDNAWVALWFACHRQETSRDGRYAHHVRRSVAREPGEHAYVTVVDTGPTSPSRVAGIHQGEKARVVDLRYALPSIYLRPHAQHGLLFSDSVWDTQRSPDLFHLIAAIVRIRLVDALEWLGAGEMLSPYSLFPPPTRDEGYRRLLEFAPDVPTQIGSIVHYGPGV